MNNENQNQAKICCSGFGEVIDSMAVSEASRHLGAACREVLLAVRSVVGAAIEREEKKSEAKLQKVTVE